jgi:hypothetical protein
MKKEFILFTPYTTMLPILLILFTTINAYPMRARVINYEPTPKPMGYNAYIVFELDPYTLPNGKVIDKPQCRILQKDCPWGCFLDSTDMYEKLKEKFTILKRYTIDVDESKFPTEKTAYNQPLDGVCFPMAGSRILMEVPLENNSSVLQNEIFEVVKLDSISKKTDYQTIKAKIVSYHFKTESHLLSDKGYDYSVIFELPFDIQLTSTKVIEKPKCSINIHPNIWQHEAIDFLSTYFPLRTMRKIKVWKNRFPEDEKDYDKPLKSYVCEWVDDDKWFINNNEPLFVEMSPNITQKIETVPKENYEKEDEVVTFRILDVVSNLLLIGMLMFGVFMLGWISFQCCCGHSGYQRF